LLSFYLAERSGIRTSQSLPFVHVTARQMSTRRPDTINMYVNHRRKRTARSVSPNHERRSKLLYHRRAHRSYKYFGIRTLRETYRRGSGTMKEKKFGKNEKPAGPSFRSSAVPVTKVAIPGSVSSTKMSGNGRPPRERVILGDFNERFRRTPAGSFRLGNRLAKSSRLFDRPGKFAAGNRFVA